MGLIERLCDVERLLNPEPEFRRAHLLQGAQIEREGSDIPTTLDLHRDSRSLLAIFQRIECGSRCALIEAAAIFVGD
ncbi:hypothetical protein ALP74_200489 [Pseudomonas coronafaciens pv. garcae]|uniref:Uncharacterized protein n=1 Tax=Pseudomonas coronafaciens pv. garcae TaxID=251653 RepID=A0AB37QIV8_9PSED|nr:hypothetical protein ALP74_200489 [Pseudomonas coronafaciens pv. garcae]